jgi:hypothetical protein
VLDILGRYASSLADGEGRARVIPNRIEVSAAIVPTDYKKAMERDGRLALVVDTNGMEHLETPAHDWTQIATIDPTKPPSIITGSVPLPPHMSLLELHHNYTLKVSNELTLDSGDDHLLRRYESMLTTPQGLGLIAIPNDILNDPSARSDDLEITFSYAPGGESSEIERTITVARKRQQLES